MFLYYHIDLYTDGSDEVCEVREKCPDQAFQCSTPDPHSTTTSRPVPSSNYNYTLISDSTILSSLAAEFEAMRARKMPIKCISRAKLCDGVFDCMGKYCLFYFFILAVKHKQVFMSHYAQFGASQDCFKFGAHKIFPELYYVNAP